MFELEVFRIKCAVEESTCDIVVTFWRPPPRRHSAPGELCPRFPLVTPQLDPLSKFDFRALIGLQDKCRSQVEFGLQGEARLQLWYTQRETCIDKGD